MEYSLCGLVITPENLESFLQAMNSNAAADQKECIQLQISIHPEHAWCITAETLDEIEVLWTGHSREHGYQLNPSELYVVNFTLNSQLCRDLESRSHSSCGLDWAVVHGLSYVAISLDALTAVQHKANLKSDSLWSSTIRSESTQHGKSALVEFFSRVRLAQVQHSLAAAIHGTRMATSASHHGNKHELPTRAKVPVLVRPVKMKPLEDLPKMTRSCLRTGRTEPSHSFLRHSSLEHTHELSINDCLRSPFLSGTLDANVSAVLLSEDWDMGERGPFTIYLLSVSAPYSPARASTGNERHTSMSTRCSAPSSPPCQSRVNIQHYHTGDLGHTHRGRPKRRRGAYALATNKESYTALPSFIDLITRVLSRRKELTKLSGKLHPRSWFRECLDDLQSQHAWELPLQETVSFLVDASYRYNLTDILFHLQETLERKRTSLASSIGQNERAGDNEEESKARSISGGKAKRKVSLSDVSEEGQGRNNSKLRKSGPAEQEAQKRQEYVHGQTKEDVKDTRRHERDQESEVIVIDDDDEPGRKAHHQDKRQQVVLARGEASNTGPSSREIHYQRPSDIPAHEDDIEVQKALLESIHNSSPCAGRHATDGQESK